MPSREGHTTGAPSLFRCHYNTGRWAIAFTAFRAFASLYFSASGLMFSHFATDLPTMASEVSLPHITFKPSNVWSTAKGPGLWVASSLVALVAQAPEHSWDRDAIPRHGRSSPQMSSRAFSLTQAYYVAFASEDEYRVSKLMDEL